MMISVWWAIVAAFAGVGVGMFLFALLSMASQRDDWTAVLPNATGSAWDRRQTGAFMEDDKAPEQQMLYLYRALTMTAADTPWLGANDRKSPKPVTQALAEADFYHASTRTHRAQMRAVGTGVARRYVGAA